MKNFDVVIIGAGPGGYVAAIRASQLGLRTAIIESKHLGGICLNWGCIPTKAMLMGAETLSNIKKSSVFGIKTTGVNFDIEALVSHSRSVAKSLNLGVEFLMKKNSIEVFEGHGKLIDKEKILFIPNDNNSQSVEIKSPHIIIATGASPRPLTGMTNNYGGLWSYFDALKPSSVPKSLLVVGSGAIGVEFASMYADFGSKVTLIELADRLLPSQDPDVSDFIEKSFNKRGIITHKGAALSSYKHVNDKVQCEIEQFNTVTSSEFEKVLVAVGVKGNVENLGLEHCRVSTRSGFIEVDEFGRTNVVGVYAIGDVTGAPCLAHKASHQAIVCVEALAGVSDVHPINENRIPGCTFCRPNIASIGITEPQAKELGIDYKIGRFYLASNGKALSVADSEGFIKVILDEHSKDILGAHFVGHEVTELIQGIGIAMSGELTRNELAKTIFAHPTISEAIQEAIMDAEGKAIHK